MIVKIEAHLVGEAHRKGDEFQYKSLRNAKHFLISVVSLSILLKIVSLVD